MDILEGGTEPPGSIRLPNGDEERDAVEGNGEYVSDNLRNQDGNVRPARILPTANPLRTDGDRFGPYADRATNLHERNQREAADESQTLKPKGKFYSVCCNGGVSQLRIESTGLLLEEIDDLRVSMYLSSSRDPSRTAAAFMISDFPNLYPYLTVHENLRFIRRLCGGSRRQVQQRIGNLSDILQLPNERRLMHNLQKSEKDRVELAAALVTSPYVLVVQKPTKEQDRSMKERIWNLLRTVSREEEVVVVLLTDDPEEAAQADDVTIVFNGCLMARDSPNRLMKDFQCETLEGVFQTLSGHHDGLEAVGVITKSSALDVERKTAPRCDAPSAGKHTVASKRRLPGFIDKTRQREVSSVSWYRVSMLFVNDLITFKRWNFGLFLGVWVQYSAILGVALLSNCLDSFRPELPVALVKSNSTSSLVDPFLASLKIGDLPFVSAPNDTSLQRSYGDLDEALASLERGETCAVMEVGGNFSSAPHYQFVLRSRADGSNAPNESVLDIDVVARGQEIRFILQRAIVLAAQKLPLRIEEAMNGSSAGMELRFDEPVFGSRSIGHLEFLAPSFFIYSTLGAAVMMAQMRALSAIVDVLFLRFVSVGVKSLEIAISAFLYLFCIQLVQIGLMLFCMCLLNWYDLLPFKGSLVLASVLFLMQGLLGIVVGLTISSLGLLLSKIVYATLWPLTMYPMGFVSWAALGPRVRFAGIIRCLDFYVLTTTSTEVLRNILYRGWGLDEDDVSGAFAGLATRIVLFCLSAFFLLKLLRFVECRSLNPVGPDLLAGKRL